MRERIGKIATDAAEAVDYRGAGTVEGMQVGDDYFFLEMNTRVQVEHCVTEMVTGIDIVREQVRIAAGEPLSITQDEMEMRGHAIECRINAEAAHKKFAPAPGKIGAYLEPSGPGVRVDSGLEAGGEVTPLYDPMVAKLITWDVDREHATRRMLRALGEYGIEGLTTLIPFHEAILATEQWAKGETCRDLLEDPEWIKSLAPEERPGAGRRRGRAAELTEREYKVEVGGRLYPVKVIGEALGGNGAASRPAASARRSASARRAAAAAASGNDVVAPLQGSIFKVEVAEGDEVEEGALIVVIEAMKMENEITAHKAGKVTKLAGRGRRLDQRRRPDRDDRVAHRPLGRRRSGIDRGVRSGPSLARRRPASGASGEALARVAAGARAARGGGSAAATCSRAVRTPRGNALRSRRSTAPVRDRGEARADGPGAKRAMPRSRRGTSSSPRRRPDAGPARVLEPAAGRSDVRRRHRRDPLGAPSRPRAADRQPDQDDDRLDDRHRSRARREGADLEGGAEDRRLDGRRAAGGEEGAARRPAQGAAARLRQRRRDGARRARRRLGRAVRRSG